MNGFTKRTFFVMHSFALRHVYHSWLLRIKEGGGIENIPHLLIGFSQLIENAKDAIGEILELPACDLAKFESEAEKVIEVMKQNGAVPDAFE